MTRRLPHLDDGVVVLRPWKVDDAPALMLACRDADISRACELPSPYTFEHAMAWIGDSRSAWSDGRDAYLAVDDAATGDVVGAISLRGVARRALSLLAAWAPGELRLSRLDFGADACDTASLRVAAKSGFRREGTLQRLVRRADERSDDAIYSLLPTDARPR